MELMEYLSDRFKKKLFEVSVELFERIERNEPTNAPGTPNLGWLSDACAVYIEMVNEVPTWSTNPMNKEYVENLRGLQWQTNASRFGVFLTVFYRANSGEVYWYADFLNASYWPELRLAQQEFDDVFHFKNWTDEPVPQFIDQTILNSSKVFEGVPDLLSPRPNGTFTQWFLEMEYRDKDSWDLDSDKFLSVRPEFIDSQPWLYEGECNVSFAGVMRPFMIVRNQLDFYVREIPQNIRKLVIDMAKNHQIYAPLSTLEQKLMENKVVELRPPRRVESRGMRIKEFIEQAMIEAANPNHECVIVRGQLLMADGTMWQTKAYWHPSALAGRQIMIDLHEAGIDPTIYYQSFPHIKPHNKIDWVMMSEGKCGAPIDTLYIEVRHHDTFYTKAVPDELHEVARDYAKKRARLFENPSFLLRDNNNVHFFDAHKKH